MDSCSHRSWACGYLRCCPGSGGMGGGVRAGTGRVVSFAGGVVLFLGRVVRSWPALRQRWRDWLAAGILMRGMVLLVYGLGGIGKSTLLRRYGQMTAEGRAVMGARGELLAGWWTWRASSGCGRRHTTCRKERWSADLGGAGPGVPGLRDAVAGRRDTAAAEKAFASFRLQVARVPELAAEVQRALPGADSGRQASAADIRPPCCRRWAAELLSLARLIRSARWACRRLLVPRIWRTTPRRRSGRGAGAGPGAGLPADPGPGRGAS